MSQASSSQNGESTESELRKMVLTFRVNELQLLLGFANRSKSGKKGELLTRALELVRTTRSVPVQQKVRELFRLAIDLNSFSRRFNEQRFTGGDNVVDTYLGGLGMLDSISPPSSSDGSSNFSPSSFASSATAAVAAAFINASSAQSTERNFIVDSHPDVKFIPLPFYDLVQTLVKPTLLRVLNQQKFQENFLAFSLSAQNMHDITYPENAPLPRYEIQLRFCLLDSTCEQKDDFPASIEVRMNDKLVQLPNVIPTNKPGVEPKRPSRPVNITSYCKHTQPQRVYIHWASDTSKNWVVGIFMVRKVSASILLTRLKNKGINPMAKSREMIKRNLQSDNEIATTSLRVSLHCPLGKMRMSIPCRLRQCKHLQCFDADLFLRMNEKKPTWVCPVCDRATPFDDLMIDGYFTEVLEKSGKEVSEIELLENGDWVPVDNDDSGGSDSDSPPPQCNSGTDSTVSTIVDSRAVNGLAGASANAARSRLLSPCSSTSTSSTRTSTIVDNHRTNSKDAVTDLVVVDLTEESDEEDAAVTTTSSLSNFAKSLSRSKGCASTSSQSCSASPSESIIILDSPPSRSTATTTPDDPIESFLRSSHQTLSMMGGSSSSKPQSSSYASPINQRNLSPPKKRFKPVSPLVSNASTASTMSLGNYENSASSSSTMSQQQQQYYTTRSSANSRGNGNYSSSNSLQMPTYDYNPPSNAFNTYRQPQQQHASYYGGVNSYNASPNYSNGSPSYSMAQSPMLSSPYNVTSDMNSQSTPHSAPPLQNGSTSFFPHHPPPLHFGPSSLAQQSAANSYMNALASFGQHRLPYVDPLTQPANTLDFLPYIDSNMQANFQKFLSACMPDSNGTS